MATYAKVAIESPLPQLDRLFDYLVPEDLIDSLRVGQQVLVPFGKNTKSIEAFVVEITDQIDFAGQVAQLQEIVSSNVLLPTNIYHVLRAVADRQAVSFGDVAKTAIPSITSRLDKKWSDQSQPQPFSIRPALLEARCCEPSVQSKTYGDVRLTANSWIHEAIELALESVAVGGSCIVCVPDFRDVKRFTEKAAALGLAGIVTQYGSDQTKTERYLAHLEAMQIRPQIVIGTRTALYAPVQNLDQIILWDDDDSSHYDQASPYASSREVALIRQKLESCSLAFLSHNRSTAVQRLVSIGYLNDTTQNFVKPAVAFSERDVRVDSLAFNTVRSGLERGPVLVQVSNLGVAKSAYCKTCSTRASCAHCTGPLWIDEKAEVRCKWCNGFNLAFRCAECGSSALRMGRAGSTRTAAELGKTFPGVQIIEATGESIVDTVDSKPKLVVSTPGAEPFAVEGYSAVLILDCDVALARDTLHAREDAVRSWSNAIALLAPKGRSALIGLGAELGRFLANWSLIDFAVGELEQRSQLAFPPVNRILSAQGEKSLVEQLVTTVTQIEGVSRLGLAPTEKLGEWRALVRFTYASGQAVADAVRVFQLKHSGVKRLNQKSGQNQRAVSIKIDDPRVL